MSYEKTAMLQILSIFSYLQSSDKIGDHQQLHRSLKQQLATLKNQLALRYCLCTAIDETVQLKNGSDVSYWQKNTLLHQFYNDSWGGERFYSIANVFLKKPKQHRFELELLQRLLLLGYCGKYSGEQQIASVVKKIDAAIRAKQPRHLLRKFLRFIHTPRLFIYTLTLVIMCNLGVALMQYIG